MMNLEEIKGLWTENSANENQAQLIINEQLLKEVSVSKVKSLLGEIKFSSWVEVLVNGVFFLFLVGFAIDHIAALKFSLPSIILALFIGFGVGSNIYKLVLLYGLQPNEPIVETQRKVNTIKYIDIVEKNALAVVIPIFLPAFLIVISKAFFDYDFYTIIEMMGNWFWVQIIWSAVVGIILVFLLRRYPHKGLRQSLEFLDDIRELKN